VGSTHRCWTNAENAGLVFGYIDRENFWARIYSKTQQKRLLYGLH